MHDEVAALVDEYSIKDQTSVSLQLLSKSGRGEMLSRTGEKSNQKFASEQILIQAANFIRREMPIRLARRIKDLDRVPLMKDMVSVRAVKDIYISSFLTLVKEPAVDSLVRESLFARKLEILYERHSSVLVQMARGAYELRDAVQRGEVDGLGISVDGNVFADFELMHDLHSFLDRFYMSRIGIRVLASQYLALRDPALDGYVGIICQNTSPYDVVKHAVNDAAYMCNRKFGRVPEVNINGRIDLTFAYIPTHLHYILLELLKNAMRATIEHHGIDTIRLPPVEVIIADGSENEDVVIKIVDEGGGIPRSHMKKIWSYLFTTADPSIQRGIVGLNTGIDHSVEAPLAGLGYGLPISRSYSKYFGGDLNLMSIEGYGTDAFVYLKRLGDKHEPIV